jgi:serine/threonine-protein kinase SRPK3
MATSEYSNCQTSLSPSIYAKSSPGDIEEGRLVYRPGGFHPVYVGDIYHERYEVLSKLGYGAYSTVWLARDTQRQ